MAPGSQHRPLSLRDRQIRRIRQVQQPEENTHHPVPPVRPQPFPRCHRSHPLPDVAGREQHAGPHHQAGAKPPNAPRHEPAGGVQRAAIQHHPQQRQVRQRRNPPQLGRRRPRPEQVLQNHQPQHQSHQPCRRRRRHHASRGGRPERLAFAQRLPTRQHQRTDKRDQAHAQPIPHEHRRIPNRGVGEPQAAGDPGGRPHTAGERHDRGEGAAVEGGAFHQGANRLEMLGGGGGVHAVRTFARQSASVKPVSSRFGARKTLPAR